MMRTFNYQEKNNKIFKQFTLEIKGLYAGQKLKTFFFFNYAKKIQLLYLPSSQILEPLDATLQVMVVFVLAIFHISSQKFGKTGKE